MVSKRLESTLEIANDEQQQVDGDNPPVDAPVDGDDPHLDVPLLWLAAVGAAQPGNDGAHEPARDDLIAYHTDNEESEHLEDDTDSADASSLFANVHQDGEQDGIDEVVAAMVDVPEVLTPPKQARKLVGKQTWHPSSK